MCGISPAIASHMLNIDPKYVPVKKRRGMDPKRSAALREEVDKLKANSFVHDALYPEWVSNPVLVKKANGKWMRGESKLTRRRFKLSEKYKYPE